MKCINSAKSRMDANIQLTINSFRQLFPHKIFFPDTSLTFREIPDISPTAVKFPDQRGRMSTVILILYCITKDCKKKLNLLLLQIYSRLKYFTKSSKITLEYGLCKSLLAFHWNYNVSQKTELLRLTWHNFTNSQHSLIIVQHRDLIQLWINSVKKFLNWLRTSCVVSIATVATWRSVSQKTGPYDILSKVL